MRYLFLALLLSCTATVHADERLPIPDAAAQKEADKLVKEVFGKEIEAATTSDVKLALTKKLLEESAAINTTPAGRYALLKAALDVAPNAKVAMSIIDEMAKRFQIEAMQAKAYTLKKMLAITSSERKALAEAAVELADAYVEQDNFPAASALMDIALDSATKSRDSQLIRDVRAKKDDVSSLEKQYANVKAALATLETDPTDTKSNLIAGKYKCFVKGEWDEGLPLLALGDDEGLKEVATKELKHLTSSGKQVALADDWFALAEKSSDEIKERMFQRAKWWYRQALESDPALPTLVMAKVKKRLGQLKDDPDVVIDGKTILISRRPFHINSEQTRRIKFEVIVPKMSAEQVALEIEISDMGDDTGDGGMYVMLLTDKAKLIARRFGNRTNESVFRYEVRDDTKWWVVLEDQDTSLGGKNPGNKGFITISVSPK